MENKEKPTLTEQDIKKEIEMLGISSSELFEVWKKDEADGTKVSHINMIREIEKTQHGAVKKLFDGPGRIRCFGRYNIDFLLEQLISLEPGESYGVMCNAYEDDNGAFRNRQGIHKKIRDESARLGMKTRLMEYSATGSKKDWLFHRLIEIAPPEKGEDFPRADYIWINQHGNTVKKVKKDPVTNKEIVTDENDPIQMENKRREWEHVLGVGSNRSSLVLKPGGAIGSFMCFGGEKGNVMDTLAKEYDITTTGATKSPSNIYEVKFEKDEAGKLSINIDYGYSSIRPGKTAIYKYE